MNFIFRLFFFFLLTSSFQLFGQLLTGRVINANTLEAIDNVLIIAYDKNENIIAYKKSNYRGAFNIMVKGVYKIEFSKLNFEKTILLSSLLKYKDIKLEPKLNVTLLDEVFVESKQYIRSSRDTTSFKANNLRNNQVVTTIEDLIEKIPGVTINATTGELKFQNRPISKILIDGDDLTGKNYQLTSKSLDQKVAKVIQVIEGYSDSELLKKFHRSQQIVINIISEEKYKNKLKGNIDLGLGNKNRFDGKSNAFLIGKRKLLSHTSYNNVGNFSLGSVSSNSNFNNTLQLNEKSFVKKVHLPSITQKSIKMRLGKLSNLTENDDFTVSENFLFNYKKTITSKINLIYYRDFLTRNDRENIFNLFKSVSVPEFVFNQKKEKRIDNLSLSVINKVKFTKNTELDFNFSIKNNNSFNNVSGQFNSNSFLETSNIDKLKSEFNMRLVKRINYKNVILLFSSFSKEKLTDSFKYQVNDEVFNFIFNTFLLQNQKVENRLSYRNNSSENQLQYIYKPNPKNVFLSSISFSKLDVSQNKNESLFENNSNLLLNILDNQDFKLTALSPEIQWSYFSKKFKLSSTIKMDYINSSFDNQVVFAPSLLAEKEMGFNKFILSYNRAVEILPFHYFFDGSIQRDVKEFFNNKTSAKLYYLTNSLALKHFYSGMKSNITTGVEGLYTFGNKPFLISTSFDKGLYVNSLTKGRDNFSSLNFKISFEKFFPTINHSLKIFPEFSSSKYLSKVNDVSYDNIDSNYSIEITSRSAFDTALNYFFGFGVNQNIYNKKSSSEELKSNNTFYNAFLNLNLKILNKKLIIVNKNEWIKYSSFNKAILFSNVEAKYKLNKFELKFSVNNISNTQNVFNRFQNDFTIKERQVSIIPRSIIGQINYIF